MNWTTFVTNASAISAIVAAIAVTAAMIFNRRAELRAVRPVVVIVYKETGWHIVNVGNGPALDVTVARKLPQGPWFDGYRVRPLGKDDNFALHWMLHDNEHEIGVTYISFDGQRYTSTCGDDVTVLRRGMRLGGLSLGDAKAEWSVRS